MLAFLNCGIAREKINRPKHTADHLQNKGTEKLQRRASLRRTGPSRRRQEAGGRGKGQTPPQRQHPLPHCKQASSFYPKTPWNSGWSTSTTGRVASRGQLLRTNTSRWHLTCTRRNWGWGCRGERARSTRGECARQAPGCLSRSGRGRHKTQVQLSPHFCGVPENWNRIQCGACSL